MPTRDVRTTTPSLIPVHHLCADRVGKKSLPTLQAQSPPRRVGTVFVPTRNARISPKPRTHPCQKNHRRVGTPCPPYGGFFGTDGCGGMGWL
ncbi:hypothetical protein, partial [Nitrosomonas mobilis]|uniref:hypothetical protein n=1 Tax=Nitrosomonas mobilis TaxID=51642 RepID=UPI001C40B6AD